MHSLRWTKQPCIGWFHPSSHLAAKQLLYMLLNSYQQKFDIHSFLSISATSRLQLANHLTDINTMCKLLWRKETIYLQRLVGTTYQSCESMLYDQSSNEAQRSVKHGGSFKCADVSLDSSLSLRRLTEEDTSKSASAEQRRHEERM